MQASRPEDRIASRRERVHILAGVICNNNCVFCMEDDREGRERSNARTTDDVVRWVLERSRGCEEVCFTAGEPTTNPRLAAWARMARDSGARQVSLMTNGRALAYPAFARQLVAAGIGRFYVSIHGHERRLHDGLTRTPGSFDQTVAGIDNLAALKAEGIEIHTSTVLNRRNLPFLGTIYRFLRTRGVDQVVFNVPQVTGGTAAHFDALMPTYREIAGQAGRFLEEQGRTEQPVMAFLVDIPLCTTTALPDFNRGYVESHAFFAPPDYGLPTEEQASFPRTGPGNDLVCIRREDLDDRQRRKRPECARCRYDAACDGVWAHYVERRGWDEMAPAE